MAKSERSIASRINHLVAIAVILAMGVLAAALSVLQVKDGVDQRRKALEATGYVYASAVAESLAN